MSFSVYILKGSSGRYYVGSTDNIQRRLGQHKRGHTSTTKRIGSPIELVFLQEFSTLDQARATEKRIKSWKRRDFIEKVIKDGRIKVIE